MTTEFVSNKNFEQFTALEVVFKEEILLEVFYYVFAG